MWVHVVNFQIPLSIFYRQGKLCQIVTFISFPSEISCNYILYKQSAFTRYHSQILKVMKGQYTQKTLSVYFDLQLLYRYMYIIRIDLLSFLSSQAIYLFIYRFISFLCVISGILKWLKTTFAQYTYMYIKFRIYLSLLQFHTMVLYRLQDKSVEVVRFAFSLSSSLLWPVSTPIDAVHVMDQIRGIQKTWIIATTRLPKNTCCCH